MTDDLTALEIVKPQIEQDRHVGETRVRRPGRLRLGCFAVVAAIVASLAFLASRSPPGRESQEEIFGYGEHQLQPVIDALEKYYAAYARYPAAISALSAVDGPTELPVLPHFRSPNIFQPEYEVSRGGDLYKLSFTYDFDEGLLAPPSLVEDSYVSFIREWWPRKYPPTIEELTRDMYSDRPSVGGMCIEYCPEEVARRFARKGGYIVYSFDPSASVTEKVVIESNDELVAFYRKEPPWWTRNRGIWIVLTDPNQCSPDERGRLDRLKVLCRSDGIPLFIRTKSKEPDAWKRY